MKTLKKSKESPKGMYEEGVIYTITINPEVQYDKNKTNLERAELETKYCIRHFLKWLKPSCDVTLIPEISRKGRWHYHGVIQVQDAYLLHAVALPLLSKSCMFEIDTIEDKEVWENYIYKDQKVMEKHLNYLGLPYILDNDTRIA